jgi:hypothetical protein
MNAPAQPPTEMVVSSIITKQASPPPWWQGLTLDQQEEALDRIDPQLCFPGQKPSMAVGRWNREKRRVHRLRQKWIEEIAALRVPCHCDVCQRHKRPPFPRYYVANRISYECWLESHVEDEEIEELLIPLRNERDRVGSVIIGRKPPKYRNIPGQ